MWDYGEVIVRREVLRQGDRIGPWEAVPVIVVEDRDDLPATFMPTDDIVVAPDSTFVVKDLELMGQRVDEGRFTAELVADVIADGDRIMAELSAGRHWWNHAWATWQPDPTWPTPALLAGWDDVSYDPT